MTTTQQYKIDIMHLLSANKRYQRRISQLVNIDREQRRRVARLTRSLAESISKQQAQARTLHEKDLMAIRRNKEIRVLTEFKETMEKTFPNIEDNIQVLIDRMKTDENKDTECPAGSHCSDSQCTGKCEPPIDIDDGRNVGLSSKDRYNKGGRVNGVTRTTMKNKAPKPPRPSIDSEAFDGRYNDKPNMSTGSGLG